MLRFTRNIFKLYFFLKPHKTRCKLEDEGWGRGESRNNKPGEHVFQPNTSAAQVDTDWIRPLLPLCLYRTTKQNLNVTLGMVGGEEKVGRTNLENTLSNQTRKCSAGRHRLNPPSSTSFASTTTAKPERNPGTWDFELGQSTVKFDLPEVKLKNPS